MKRKSNAQNDKYIIYLGAEDWKVQEFDIYVLIVVNAVMFIVPYIVWNWWGH